MDKLKKAFDAFCVWFGRDWRINFAMCAVLVMVLGIVLYAIAGPFGLLLWSGASFGFGAMWRTITFTDE